MKPGLVSTYDLKGGASRSAYRLHQGLRESGIDSQMFVQQKQSSDAFIHAPRPNLPRQLAQLRPWLSELPLRRYSQRPHTPFSTNRIPDYLDSIVDRLHQASVDIVNLHWISDGFFPLTSLLKLKVPIVWTLHDMWAMTGGCHYSGECDRYQKQCQYCPQLRSETRHDLSFQEFQRKKQLYEKLNLTIVCPSEWLKSCAKKSVLFRDFRIEVIPYGVEVQIFRPIAQDVARSLLKLPANTLLILVGAVNINDTRKGFDFLRAALEQLKSSKLFHLVVFGEVEKSWKDLGYPIHFLGTMSDDLMLALTYSAVDIFVAPSIQDNLPNTVLEAMACGTPTVAFNIGGMPDLIDSGLTGYLAKPFDIHDLADGIKHISKHIPEMSRESRKKAEEKFALNHQAQGYKDLFENLLTSNK
jgi:glycosyltransferase involved in cell wall biosynthesis